MGDLIEESEKLHFYPPREKGKTDRPYLLGLATSTTRILMALCCEPTGGRWETERELEILT